jgi:hypothetical protein
MVFGVHKRGFNNMIKYQKKPCGRPTSYRPEYAEQAYRVCLLGATDKQLADFFKVAESTINLWKLRQPEFLAMLNKGKLIADAQVAEALYKMAIGYSHPETHIAYHHGKVIKIEIIKRYPPNTKACIFWLKNRQPKLWGERIEPKQQTNLNKFPPKEELDAMYEKRLAEAARRNAKVIAERRAFLQGKEI